MDVLFWLKSRLYDANYSPVNAASVAITAGHRCGYCLTSQRISGAQMHVEHIIPVGQGGTSDESNLWLACAWCNSYKAAKTHAVDPSTGVLGLCSILARNRGLSTFAGATTVWKSWGRHRLAELRLRRFRWTTRIPSLRDDSGLQQAGTRRGFEENNQGEMFEREITGMSSPITNRKAPMLAVDRIVQM